MAVQHHHPSPSNHVVGKAHRVGPHPEQAHVHHMDHHHGGQQDLHPAAVRSIGLPLEAALLLVGELRSPKERLGGDRALRSRRGGLRGPSSGDVRPRHATIMLGPLRRARTCVANSPRRRPATETRTIAHRWGVMWRCTRRLAQRPSQRSEDRPAETALPDAAGCQGHLRPQHAGRVTTKVEPSPRTLVAFSSPPIRPAS